MLRLLLVALAELVALVERGDWVEAEHVVAALPALDVAVALAGPLRAEKLAVLHLGGEVPELWPFVETFAELAGLPDRSLAAPAARAAAQMAERLAGGDAELWDVPRNVMVSAYRRCAQVAAGADVWPDVRGDAAACALALGEALGAEREALAELVTRPMRASGDPEVRLAAVGVLLPGGRGLLGEMASTDGDDSVAAAALAALCLSDPHDAVERLGAGAAARLERLRRTEPDPGLRAAIDGCL